MIPSDLLYTEQHEWLKISGDTAIMGVTDFAQNSLGDVTFVELPNIGDTLTQGEEACSVESTKAASSVYAPASGEVCEVNTQLEEAPELINEDPYGEGWICKFKLSDPTETQKLLDAVKYEALTEE